MIFVDGQINELTSTIKNMELNIVDYKKKERTLESKMKQMEQTFESMRNERNILNKNLLKANVIHATLLFFICHCYTI